MCARAQTMRAGGVMTATAPHAMPATRRLLQNVFIFMSSLIFRFARMQTESSGF